MPFLRPARSAVIRDPYHVSMRCPCAGCGFRLTGWVDSGSARLGRFFKHQDRVFTCPDCKLHGHNVALDWK